MKSASHLKTLMLVSLFFFASSNTLFAEHKRLNVVATFSIIGDFAQQVGGEHIDLRTLVEPDSDAHVYEPRPSDARTLAKADIILMNGLQFEGFITRLIEASETTAKISVLSNGAEILDDPEGGHYHFVDGKAIFHPSPRDAHAWQSITNAKIYVANIARDFCALDAAHCETYRENAANYTEQLTELETRIRLQLQAIPQNKLFAVVAHNAFRYFGEAHGITFLSPQGISTEAEASAADVAKLIREMRDKNIKAVFAENISNDRLIQQIAQEAGTTVSGTLYSDALSAPNGAAPTYEDMMAHNAAVLAQALQ